MLKNDIKEAHDILAKVLDEARGAASIVISAEEMRAIRKLLDHAERTFGIPDPPPPPGASCSDVSSFGVSDPPPPPPPPGVAAGPTDNKGRR